MARGPRAPGRIPFAAAGLLALVLAACGAGDASPPPGASPGASFAWPSGVPRLRDMVPEEVEGIPVDPGTEPIEGGEYSWRAFTGEEGAGYGEIEEWGLAFGVETIWDPDLGIIILGPEETGDEVSQLILSVGDLELDGQLPITAATLSWTAKRSGSFHRGEAELFELAETPETDFKRVKIKERGPNYLKGTFTVLLEEADVLIGGSELDEGEIYLLQLSGFFTAVEP